MESLKVISEQTDQILTLRFIGSIDENSSLAKVNVGSEKEVVIDVAGVTRINSMGCKEWIKWIKTFDPQIKVHFLNCNTTFLDYVNMVADFLPKNGSVVSFQIPYFCESCSYLTYLTFDSSVIKTSISNVPDKSICGKCKGEAKIDVFIPNFFNFLKK